MALYHKILSRAAPTASPSHQTLNLFFKYSCECLLLCFQEPKSEKFFPRVFPRQSCCLLLALATASGSESVVVFLVQLLPLQHPTNLSSQVIFPKDTLQFLFQKLLRRPPMY